MTTRSPYWFGITTILFSISLLAALSAKADSKNGFDLSNASVPSEQILRGGPPRDGIPAIDSPRFVAAKAASFMQAGDRLLALSINGENKAYPIKILNWHEIVNDQLGGEAVAVTWCPLCGSGVVFSADVAGQQRDFGVSGLLYQSDVLLYDRQSESLFSQLEAEAISGPLLGEPLRAISVSYSGWEAWRQRYPDGLVLTPETGYRRDYDRNPYQGYDQSRQLYFSVNNSAPPVLHPKERVYGIEYGGFSKAYPTSELEARGNGSFTDQLGDFEVQLQWDGELGRLLAYAPDQSELVPVTAFWFAWFTFNPESQVYSHNNDS